MHVLDFAKKRKALRRAAWGGDAAAQSALGALCLHGYGVPQNRAAAARRYEKAANQARRNEMPTWYARDRLEFRGAIGSGWFIGLGNVAKARIL